MVLMKDSITSSLKEHSSDSDRSWQVAMATAGNWRLGWYQWTSDQHWSITLPPTFSYDTKMRSLLAFLKRGHNVLWKPYNKDIQAAVVAYYGPG